MQIAPLLHIGRGVTAIISVVFPPPPMIAVTPGWISSAFCSFTEHTSL